MVTTAQGTLPVALVVGLDVFAQVKSVVLTT